MGGPKLKPGNAVPLYWLVPEPQQSLLAIFRGCVRYFAYFGFRYTPELSLSLYLSFSLCIHTHIYIYIYMYVYTLNPESSGPRVLGFRL